VHGKALIFAVLRYLVSAPALRRACRVSTCAGTARAENQHDEERARERKVDMSAQLTGVIRELLSHGRAEALRKEIEKSAEELPRCR
jgi:hypothetical protein